MALANLPLSRSGETWVQDKRDLWEAFYIEPLLYEAEQIARARGGRKITAEDLDQAEEEDLPLPPDLSATEDTEGDGRA